MSGVSRHRDGWLPGLLRAAFLVIALGNGAAWPAAEGGDGRGLSVAGHGGGFGGGHGSGSFPGGRDFGRGGFGGRPVPHDHDRDGRPIFVLPFRAIDLARSSGALLLELRATISLSRRRPRESAPALAGICRRFPEGASLADLEDARRLLGEG